MSEKIYQGVSRRGFLKTTAAAAGVAALSGSAMTALAETKPTVSADEQVFHGVCRCNCMAACRYYGTVRDGKLVQITPAEYDTELYSGCCLRGMSYQNRIYSPTRIKQPMKRIGERGAGQWEVLDWETAIKEIAEKLMKVHETYGGAAVAFDASTGNYGEVYGAQGIWNRLGAQFGWSKPFGMNDLSTGYGIDRVIGTGLMYYSSETADVMNASHAIEWGSNPVHSCPNNWRVVERAQENGTQVIVIDPVKTATAMKADVFIPIKPTTDGMMLLAMCNHIVQNKLWDEQFVNNRSNATFLVREDNGKFLRASDIVAPVEVPEGEEAPAPDTTPLVWDEAAAAAAPYGTVAGALEGTFEVEGIKVSTAFTLLKKQLEQYTIAKAVDYTGVPEASIMYLIDVFVNGRGVMVDSSFGMDHYYNGYQSNWALAILMALTGNLARAGAGFYGIHLNTNVSINIAGLWVAAGYKGFGAGWPAPMAAGVAKTQSFMGQPYPFKAMIHATSNSVSNWPDQNSYINDLLPNMDITVCIDMEMTDTARYADYVLPMASYWEEEDFRKCHNLPYFTHQEKAIEPLHEAKTDIDIVKLLAKAMGVEAAIPEDFTFETCASLLLNAPTCEAYGITLENLRKNGFINIHPHPEYPVIKGEKGFDTELGLARLYTEAPAVRASYGQDVTARFPKEHLVYFQPSDECDENSEAAKKYPLVFFQEHTRWRTHSQWFEAPLMKELDPEPLFKISRPDAEARGIKDMDIVEVFNDRGHMVLRAVIDDALPQGVSRTPKGWQRHQYIAGGYQELTNPIVDEWSVAFNFYDTRVDVKKWEE